MRFRVRVFRQPLSSPAETFQALLRRLPVPRSVLEAIREGEWDYEPELPASDGVEATKAIPGSTEKLTVLADRLRRGLPLWHPRDRLDYEAWNER